jgi:hypothetical protein
MGPHVPWAGLTLLPLCVQSAEVFTLTYGSIVRQLIADLEDLEEVNKQLDQMYAPVAVAGSS